VKQNKLLLILGGLVLLVILGAVVGPGPLLPGLGPPFDQPVGVLAVLCLVAVGLIWLFGTIRKARSPDNKLRGNSCAEQILRERYARGELDRAQFAQMLNDLRSDLSPNL
jgi:uncharacterized membrane protein